MNPHLTTRAGQTLKGGLMTNPLGSLGISQSDIDEAMKGEEVRDGKMELAKKAAAYWRSVSPEDEGEYKDSIDIVVKGDDVIIRADAEHAHIVEYGTSTMAEFAPRAKTQARFGREE